MSSRSTLDELNRLRLENQKLRAILKLIDDRAGPADSTCDKPGIKLSTACRLELRDQGHPLFTKKGRR